MKTEKDIQIEDYTSGFDDAIKKRNTEIKQVIEKVLKCSSYLNKEIGFTCDDEGCITCNYKKELLQKLGLSEGEE